jgi:hypothetical protein
VVLVISTGDAEAKRVILTDDFFGLDASRPDVEKWDVLEESTMDMAQVYQGHLTTWAQDSGHAYVTTSRPFSNENLTLTIEFQVDTIEDICFDLTLMTGDGTMYWNLLSIKHEGTSWEWIREWEGDSQKYIAGKSWLVARDWYVAELDIYMGNANFSAWRQDTNETIWSFTNLTLEPMGSRSLITFGVDAYLPGSSPRTNWDNFTLVDHTAPANGMPQWVALPDTLFATEDQVLTYDFTTHILDDQEPWELSLESPSPFVSDINGLTVSFLFPNNVTVSWVTLIAFDGHIKSPEAVLVEVTPVNDPPSHAIPVTLSATEGIETLVNLEGFIWDIDNPDSELELLVSSQFIQVEGFKLRVYFPEGTEDYPVALGITDGIETTWVTVTFLITHIDNPPILLPIEDIEIMEDQTGVLDLAPYVSDVDDAIWTLRVSVSSIFASVHGLNITFLYPDGGYTDEVIIRVSDAVNMAQQTLRVTILARDDAPFIEDIPEMEVYEDQVTIISLEDYISDEETSRSELLLRCEHPMVRSVQGLVLTVLYPDWLPSDTIPFNVTDGGSVTLGWLDIIILEVNDLPTIHSVGGRDAPFNFHLPENTQRSYTIDASDPDDLGLWFTVEATWDGFSVSGRTLYFNAERGDAGDHVGWLNAWDDSHGKDRVKITVHVVTKEDIPVEVDIVSPANHTAVSSGQLVSFMVNVDDPEGYLEGPVEVKWRSDISGVLGVIDLVEGGDIAVSDLADGRHTIQVTVTDGTVTVTRWIIVEVGEGTEEASSAGIVYIWVIITLGIMVAIIFAFLTIESREIKTSTVQESSSTTSREVADSRMARLSRDRKLETTRDTRARKEEEAREARILKELHYEEMRKAKGEERFRTSPSAETLVDRAEHHPEARRVRPPTRAGGSPLPSEDEMRVLKNVIAEALDELPGGLPSALSLYDPATIANRIVKGRKMWSDDGRLLAFIQGQWYYAHPSDEGFMKVYDGP